MSDLIHIDSYQDALGHTITVGDNVRCTPPGKNSFPANVKQIKAHPMEHVTVILDGEELPTVCTWESVFEVTVFGGPGGYQAFRTFTPDRIKAVPPPKPKKARAPRKKKAAS